MNQGKDLPKLDEALPADEVDLFKACLSPLSVNAVNVSHSVRRRGSACREQVPLLPALLVY